MNRILSYLCKWRYRSCLKAITKHRVAIKRLTEAADNYYKGFADTFDRIKYL